MSGPSDRITLPGRDLASDLVGQVMLTQTMLLDKGRSRAAGARLGLELRILSYRTLSEHGRSV